MCIWASKLFIRHQFLFVYLYSYIPTLRLDPQKIACGRCGAFIELLNTILTFDWVSKYFTLRSSIVHENKSLPRSEKKQATLMVFVYDHQSALQTMAQITTKKVSKRVLSIL
uniref:Uncharacterized protein n=1 Tax=Cacopsylla melanoneura TaxID=428564 RepID=A0A8D8TD16_9HEMI